MTAQPITCTWDEGKRLDDTEANLLTLWGGALTNGHSPYFVAALIAAAVDFDPRLGLHMDACTRHGCNVLVDERARDDHGRLFCSSECEDDHAETTDAHMRHALLVDGRYDVGRKEWAA
jgi:hypothetical protein